MAKRQDDNREVIETQLGGLHRAGNASRMPAGKTTEAKNLFLRPGNQVVKRSGVVGETVPGQPTFFFKYGDYLMHNTYGIPYGAGMVAYRNAGVWTDTPLFGGRDFVEYKSKLYGLIYGTPIPSYVGGLSDPSTLLAWDGSNGEGVYGSSICAEIGRLFVSDPVFQIINKAFALTSYKFETAWTPTNMTVAVVGNKRKLTTTVVAAATKIVTGVVGTAGAVEEILTAAIHLQPVAGLGREVPITLRVVDAAGSTLGQTEVLVPRAEVDSAWHLYAIEPIRVPAGTAYSVHLVPGTTFTAAQVNDAVYASEYTGVTATNKGLLVKNGAYVPETFPMLNGLVVPSPVVYESWPGRIAYCEVNDTRIWKSEYYSDTRRPALTLLRTANGYVYAFGSDSITVFQLTDNADLPIAATGVVIDGIGCYGIKSWELFEGKQYFADANGVYKWDGTGMPEQLLDEGVLEDILTKDATAPSFALTIDRQRRELYYCGREGRIYVLNLDRMEWTWLEVKDSDGETISPVDIIWSRTENADGEIWFTFQDNTGQYRLGRFSETQRKDDTHGTEQDIDAEYWLHPIETSPQAKAITLETLEIQHEVTYDQSDSTIQVSVSRDGGTTFTPTTAPKELDLANGDSIPAKFPLRSTGRKQIIKIVHSGEGGEDAFNMNSAAIWIKTRGNVKQPTNTT